MRRISARISSRSLASRLDSGSSISTSGGSTTMARAMATRCCWPPESWPGSLSAWLCSRTSASASSTRLSISALGSAAHLQAEADIAAHVHVREQRVVLEHHAEAALFGPQRVDPLLVEPDAAAGRRQQPGDAVQRRRLAAARGAEQRDELALADRQRDVLEGVVRSEIAAQPIELQFAEIGGMYRHGSHAVAGRRGPAHGNRKAEREGRTGISRCAGLSAGAAPMCRLRAALRL